MHQKTHSDLGLSLRVGITPSHMSNNKVSCVVSPGHGRRYRFADIEDKNVKLEELIQNEEAKLMTTNK